MMSPTGRKTILVVDDDQAVLDVASRVLRRAGYEVLPALGAMHALEVAGEHSGRIDLLLTDVVMPRMNGRRLSEKLVAEIPDLSVLYMSGFTEDDVILRGIRVNEVRLLQKPFTLDELTTAVQESLAGRPG